MGLDDRLPVPSERIDASACVRDRDGYPPEPTRILRCSLERPALTYLPISARSGVAQRKPGAASEGLLGRLLTPFFAKVNVEVDAVQRLQEAYERGVVVHVLRVRRVLDPLFILHALDRLGLEAPHWVHDHYATRAEPSIAAAATAIQGGGPAPLLLRRP